MKRNVQPHHHIVISVLVMLKKIRRRGSLKNWCLAQIVDVQATLLVCSLHPTWSSPYANTGGSVSSASVVPSVAHQIMMISCSSVMTVTVGITCTACLHHFLHLQRAPGAADSVLWSSTRSLTRLDHQRQSDMGERLEVNVQLKRLKDTKTTGDIIWKAWRNTAFHAGISQATKGMTRLRA